VHRAWHMFFYQLSRRKRLGRKLSSANWYPTGVGSYRVFVGSLGRAWFHGQS
jgi:hypothetical protein